MRLDPSFNFRSDTPAGRDPDRHSPTLRRYHQALWSKPLPSGQMFELQAPKRGAYLLHDSAAGRFHLASDTAVPTFRISAKHLKAQLPVDEVEHFHTLQYTIGAMMVWPANRIDGKQTINQARGFHPRIADRLDLTLECIRRHFAGGDQANPLAKVLDRYASFFELFRSFEHYVEFFLLQDLVTRDRSQVRFFMRFDDFELPARPQDLDSYRQYMRLAVGFIEARNRRIDALGVSARDQACASK